MTFYDGTTVLGSTKLSTKTKGGVVTYTSLGGTSSSASSKGTTSQPGLAAGTHSLTAAYSGATGSPALLASTSAVYSQVISQVSIDISLSAKTVGKTGQTYMFSANLACDAAGCDSGNFQNYFPPTLSNVMFYDGSTLLGSAPALTVSSNDGGFSDWAAQFSTSSLSPGTHTITATYADTNYSLSTSNAQTVFVGGTPTLTWTTPAAIAYGTALSATQLNATDTIPGTFVYSPASGTIPGVGTQSLRSTLREPTTRTLATNQDRLAAGKSSIDGNRGDQREPVIGRLTDRRFGSDDHGAVVVVWRRCHSHGGRCCNQRQRPRQHSRRDKLRCA